MVYLIPAFSIGIVSAIALSSYMHGVLSFLIFSYASLCVMTFIKTLYDGNNVILTGDYVGDIVSEETWFLFPLMIPIFVASVVAAPVMCLYNYIEDEYETTSVFVGIISILSVMLLFLLVLFISPQTAYALIPCGGIIPLYIVLSAVVVVLTSVALHEEGFSTLTTVLFYVGAGLMIVLMIIGINVSMNRTYYISDANDMRGFANSPTSYETVFIVENDIDFEDEDTSWFGGMESFEGIFEGNGYTFSNISFDGYYNGEGMGLVAYNEGVIRNINFKDCSFSVKNDIEGSSLNFGIICSVNNGKISNCNIIDCQAKGYKYYSSSSSQTSLKVGYNYGTLENVEVTYTREEDPEFYNTDAYKWFKIN